MQNDDIIIPDFDKTITKKSQITITLLPPLSLYEQILNFANGTTIIVGAISAVIAVVTTLIAIRRNKMKQEGIPKDEN